MKALKPYTLKQRQRYVEDALSRMRPRHAKWRMLERLVACGSVSEYALAEGLTAEEVGTLTIDRLGVPLETINQVLPQVQIILASVIARDPSHLVAAVGGGPEAEDNAVVAQALLKYYWSRMGATEVLRDQAQDGVVIGAGISKTFWNFSEHEEDRDEEERYTEVEALIEADRELTLEDNELGDDMTDFEELESQVAATEAVIDVDEPATTYVSPYDFFVPREARRLEDARWTAQRICLPIDEIAALYNVAEDDVIADGLVVENGRVVGNDDVRHGDDSDDDGILPFATIYEFWDTRTRTMSVFQLHGEKDLYTGAWPHAHRHTPFSMVRAFNDGGSEFWPFGYVENIAAIQLAYNELFQEQIDNARRAGTIVAVNDEYATDEMEDVLEDPQHGRLLRVKMDANNGVTDIRQVLQSFEFPELSGDVYNGLNTLKEGIREVLGTNDFQAGGSGADRMSATAAAVMDGVATLRAQDMIASVERAGAHMAQLVLLLAQEFLSPETEMRLTGKDGQALWTDVSPDDINGEFLVTIENGSTRPVNPATRQQRAMDRANAMTSIINTMMLMQQAGIDGTAFARAAVTDLGLDPDEVLAALPAQPAPADPAMAGQMPAPAQAGLPEVPVMPVLEQLGGPPVPAQGEGGIAL